MDGGSDQAAGLRRLFGSPSAQVIAFAPGVADVKQGAFLARTATMLAGMGQGVAVVDENGGSDGPLASLGVAEGHDLFQALTGECTVRQTMVHVAPLLRAASARRAARVMERGEYGLSERYAAFLAEAKRDAAYVLINCARRAKGASLSPLAIDARHVVVVTTAAAASITAAYALIKRIVGERGHGGLHLAVTGASDEGEARVVFANMQRVARDHLGVTIDYLGYGREHLAHGLTRHLPPGVESPTRNPLPLPRQAVAARDSVI
ncbi:hypothetical protein CBW56_02535 [Denitratisoma oestradiolicum]|nr:hypothetical protein CBW56_02535 [Denitratisoma oestradiolicum]